MGNCIIKRRPGTAFRVGKAVITIYEVRSSSVKIGIKAPPEIPIVRCELENMGVEGSVDVAKEGQSTRPKHERN